MTTPSYIFTETQFAAELNRLRVLEGIFDPTSQRRLAMTGLTAGWQCLEVGAGAGSLTHWLSTQVGAAGRVTALDLDTRFLKTPSSPSFGPTVEIVSGDIRHYPLPESHFDVIHTRYVLIHIPEFQAVLQRLIQALKPGGWLVLEEPDFSAARVITGQAPLRQSMDCVNQAIVAMFAQRGMDPALGVHLPGLLQDLGCWVQAVDQDVPLAAGGAPIAMLMHQSAQHLASAYIATGLATSIDIEHYGRLAADPRAWAIYYASVGIMAQTPLEPKF